jgi:hypothetical protein
MAEITGDETESVYRYYIKVTDSLGLSVASPEHAPVNLHTFTAANDFIKPNVNHISPMVSPIILWPAAIIAEITDASGLDSVRVECFWEGVEAIEHEAINIYGHDRRFSAELLAHYMRRDGVRVTVPMAAFYDRDTAGQLLSMRTFIDLQPVFDD